MTRVAHIVREGNALTEPFIARRVAVPIRGIESEQWSEVGSGPEGIELVRVASRLIAPGGLGARVFHLVPQAGVRQAAEYRAVAGTRRPDILHAHYLTTGYLACRSGVPVVASAYGFDVSVLPRRALWRRALRDLGSRVGAVLVEGPHMRDTVVSLGVPADRVRIVRIAVGHERLPAVSRTHGVSTGPRLLAAGRFVEKKGFALAIGAVAALRTRWPEATLDIVGAGPLDGALRAAAATAGDAVRFLGRLDRPAYLAAMASADVFLAPSVTAANGDSEGGAPTTILDAQAVGTIVVGSTHADIPFLVEDGQTGYLAPEGSLDGLVATLARALDDQARWAQVAASAREAVLRDHSDVALAAGLADAYAGALQ